MRRAVAPQRPVRRASMPQIAIEPGPEGFAVRVGGCTVQLCADEMAAHHWGKHAFEAVNQGLRRPGEVGRAMHRLCLNATRYNLHTYRSLAGETPEAGRPWPASEIFALPCAGVVSTG